MRKIQVALIGLNFMSHAQQVCNSILKQTELFELVGYALPENEREKFPQVAALLDGYPEMTVEQILNDPEIEAVVIETEEIYLLKYAILAAKHKKHIHMEKPGGQDAKQFAHLVSTLKENKTVFHIGYMYRYNPYIQALLEDIRKGELGQIISVDAEMNCFHEPQNRQWLSCFEGGMMFFLGCHLIDLVLQIQGKPKCIIPFNKCTGVDGVTATDFGMAVLEYDNAVSTVKTTAMEIGGYARRHLVVTGTKKTVELRPLEMLLPEGHFTEKTEYTRPEYWEHRGDFRKSEVFDRYDPMMAAFAQMVRGEQKNPYTYDYELELYKTVLACCGISDNG